MTGGLSAAGLRWLHDVLARHVDDGAPPGLVAAVSRRGQVHGTETAPDMPGYAVIHAEVPAHELSRYPIDLRSVSHGTGTFKRSFVRYDYMPAALAREVISA